MLQTSLSYPVGCWCENCGFKFNSHVPKGIELLVYFGGVGLFYEIGEQRIDIKCPRCETRRVVRNIKNKD